MQTLVLSGPGKNALSTELMERTLARVREAGDDALLLTGEGDAFSAGLNLKEVASLDVAGLTRFLGTLEDLVEALYRHPGPTVAWVNGHAVAGGCVLALACDWRVMTTRDEARIGLNEVALGLRFPPRTAAMVAARLAAPVLERVLLEAALYRPREALALGIVHEVANEDAARAKLEALAAHPRDGYAAAKRVLRPPFAVSGADSARFREETIPMWASDEQKARLRAVLGKR